MPSAHRVCPAAFTLHIQSPRAYAGTYETPVIYRALRVGHKRMAFNAFIAWGHRASRFDATPRAGIRKAHMCVCVVAVYMFASPERARADTLQTQSERAHQIMTQHRGDRAAFHPANRSSLHSEPTAFGAVTNAGVIGTNCRSALDLIWYIDKYIY